MNARQYEDVVKLRQGSEKLFLRESRTLQHDFKKGLLWLDIDLMPLPVSKNAKVRIKGRQLARIIAPQYKETIFSRIYPGKPHAYIPLIEGLNDLFEFLEAQREATVLRTDSGFGGDANINLVLGKKWQVLTKGSQGHRPNAFAKQIQKNDWQRIGDERWVAKAVSPPTYVRSVQHLVLRWKTASAQIKNSTVVCSINDWSMEQVISHFDEFGASARTSDKALKFAKRRKKNLAAQEALILLTDVAHNILAWASSCMFPTGPLATTPPIPDLFQIPGRLIFDEERLIEVHLNEQHPHAEEVMHALTRLLAHFELATGLRKIGLTS